MTLFGKSTPPIQDDSSMKEFYHQLYIKNKPNIPLKWRDYLVVFAKQEDWRRSPLIESLSEPISSFRPGKWCFSTYHILNMASICSDSNKQIQPPSLLWYFHLSSCASQSLCQSCQLSLQLCGMVPDMGAYAVVRVSLPMM